MQLPRFVLIIGAVVAGGMPPHLAAAEPGVITGKPCSEYVNTVPAPFLKLYQAYRDWSPKPNDEEDTYTESVYNYAQHALTTAQSSLALIAGARNWVFTRSEEKFREMARVCAPELKERFGLLFLSRGLQTVAARPYDEEAERLYVQWYTCMANTPGHNTNTTSRGEDVLHDIAWRLPNSEFDSSAGEKDECRSQFGELSAYYGVIELTPDDLVVAGFLHRRALAHARNPRFIAAETVRTVVHEIFDPEE